MLTYISSIVHNSPIKQVYDTVSKTGYCVTVRNQYYGTAIFSNSYPGDGNLLLGL